MGNKFTVIPIIFNNHHSENMAFNFFGQPFIGMEPIFGIPQRCGPCRQRCLCNCRPNSQRCGESRQWSMDKLIEEARRQVKLEQSSGAINDYFAALDSIVNAFNGTKQTANNSENSTDKFSEKPEVNSGSKVDGAEKTHDKPETNPDHVEENKKPEEYCPTFPDFLAAVIHELTKDPSKETKTDEKPVSTPENFEPVSEQDNLKEPETLKQPSKLAEIKPAKDEDQVAKVPARLNTKVNVAEDLEKVQIQIEFTGYHFEPEHLDVQLIDENVLVVCAEDGEQNFERKFKLSPKCLLDKIMPKFKADEEKQTMVILIPKEVKKVVNIPICTDDN